MKLSSLFSKKFLISEFFSFGFNRLNQKFVKKFKKNKLYSFKASIFSFLKAKTYFSSLAFDFLKIKNLFLFKENIFYNP